MILPIAKSTKKVLEKIYSSSNVKISDLLRETKVSPNVGYPLINGLLKDSVIEEKITGEGKPVLRILSPNLGSESGKLVFSLIEKNKSIVFFEGHKELRGAFEHLSSELGKTTAVIFGSYARGTETADSDIDLLLILDRKGEKEKLEKICETCFVTLKARVSPRIIAANDFRQMKEKDEVIKGIIREHVCVHNCLKWIELVA